MELRQDGFAQGTEAWIASHRARLLDGLDRFLRLPSVSTVAAHQPAMERTTEFLLTHVSGIGLRNAQLLDGGGHKTVYAEWLGAEGAPTFRTRPARTAYPS